MITEIQHVFEKDFCSHHKHVQHNSSGRALKVFSFF